MSGKALGWARDQTTAGGARAKALLLLLADHAGADHECWPKVETLATELQLSERTVQRALSALEAERIVSREVRATVKGRQRSNLYVLAVDQPNGRFPTPMGDNLTPIGVTETTSMGDTPVTHMGDTPVTPTTLKLQIEAPVKQVSSDELTQRVRAGETSEGAGDEFGEALAAYPETGRVRTNLRTARKRWTEACTLVEPARLVAAIRRYAAEDRDLRRGDHGAPRFEHWLGEERWRVWLADAAGRLPADAPTVFAGPPELRDAVVAAKGEGFAGSFLDPCAWSAAERRLTARFRVGAERLRREIGALLDGFGVTVADPAAASAGDA